MIIISQNKKIIVNFDNVTAIEYIDDEVNKEGKVVKSKKAAIGIATTSGRSFFVGEFKNKQKASEVIKNITAMYRSYRETKDGQTVVRPKVYEIPEEVCDESDNRNIKENIPNR